MKYASPVAWMNKTARKRYFTGVSLRGRKLAANSTMTTAVVNHHV